MEFVTLGPFIVPTLVWEQGPGAFALSVCAKATFSLVHEKDAAIADVQDGVHEDVHFDSRPDAALYAPTDFVPMKPKADVLVVGAARAQEGAIARVAVGDFEKSARVTGLVSAVFGPVAPRARAAQRGLAPEAIAWIDRIRLAPGPAPPGLDFGFFNAAPPDQQIDRIPDGAVIALENLHPSLPLLTTRLPAFAPRAFHVDPAGQPAEVKLRCDTIWIDADRVVAVVSWRGNLPLAGPPDRAMGRLFVAAQGRGDPLSFADVERLAALRRETSTPRASVSPSAPPAAAAPPALAGKTLDVGALFASGGASLPFVAASAAPAPPPPAAPAPQAPRKDRGTVAMSAVPEPAAPLPFAAGTMDVGAILRAGGALPFDTSPARPPSELPPPREPAPRTDTGTMDVGAIFRAGGPLPFASEPAPIVPQIEPPAIAPPIAPPPIAPAAIAPAPIAPAPIAPAPIASSTVSTPEPPIAAAQQPPAAPPPRARVIAARSPVREPDPKPAPPPPKPRSAGPPAPSPELERGLYGGFDDE